MRRCLVLGCKGDMLTGFLSVGARSKKLNLLCWLTPASLQKQAESQRPLDGNISSYRTPALAADAAAALLAPNAGNSSPLVSRMLGCKSFYQLESLTELLKNTKPQTLHI